MASNGADTVDPVYLSLATESDDPFVTEIESVCLNCMEKGMTRLLLTTIPHFKEVMVSSFSCDFCNYKDSGLINTGCIQDKGIKLTLTVSTKDDLQRTIVKSDYANIKIPSLELEVPSEGTKGEISSVEGIVSKVCDGLRYDQAVRRAENPDLAAQIDAFITKLEALLEVVEPFVLELNDPTGNSFIDGSGVGAAAMAAVVVQHYTRTDEQNDQLGLAPAPVNGESVDNDIQKIVEEEEQEKQKDLKYVQEALSNTTKTSVDQTTINAESNTTESLNENGDDNIKENREDDGKEKVPDNENDDDVAEEVIRFNTLCDRCYRPGTTNMKLVNIPHFKEVVLMSTNCDHCGHRTNEVKAGGGIAPLGRRLVLKLIDSDEVDFDLSRDVLKSETCSVEIPELQLHVGGGLLGGKFTTLEGLLINIKDDLNSNPFFTGDSVTDKQRTVVQKLFLGIDQIMSGELKGTVILDDPAGNSYMQNLYAPDPDPRLTVTDYTRSEEQDDDLGITDMKTEGYEEDAETKEGENLEGKQKEKEKEVKDKKIEEEKK